jgi:hypothetical protein
MRPPDALTRVILPALHELQNSYRVKWLTTYPYRQFTLSIAWDDVGCFFASAGSRGMIRIHQTEPTNDH